MMTSKRFGFDLDRLFMLALLWVKGVKVDPTQVPMEDVCDCEEITDSLFRELQPLREIGVRKFYEEYGSRAAFDASLLPAPSPSQNRQSGSPKGAIFDMDGLILDTELMAQAVWFALAMVHDADATPADMRCVIGRNTQDSIKAMCDRFGDSFPASKLKGIRKDVLSAYLESYGAPLKGGATEILAFLAQRFPVAVATSSDCKLAEHLLQLAGVREYITCIIGGDQVKNGKPDPECYLKAAEAIGVLPDRALAFEDSNPGVIAGVCAGCRVYMVPDILPPLPEVLGSNMPYSICSTLLEAKTAIEYDLGL